MPRPGWSSVENANHYADFTRRYPLYQRTSEDLASLLALQDANLVVDLACGTGATTKVLLDKVSGDARIIAVDGSEAMQAIARERITDPRVARVSASWTSLCSPSPGRRPTCSGALPGIR
jgi:trans-aconitate methyltransferase